MDCERIEDGLDYASIVAASERVDWTVDGIFRDRGFDASGPIVPASWVGTDTLGFLDDRTQRTLNHCRAFSYVHLLGNFEEFAPPHVTGMAQDDWHDDRARLRALLRFGDEELKHQQLFRRAERVLEESCGHPFGGYFDAAGKRVAALTRAILAHPSLARSLMVLALEWGTQRHYVESIRDARDERADMLYADVLRAHWVEESQHIKCGTLEIARQVRAMSTEERSRAFDQVGHLGGLVDAVFAGQVEEEIATVERVTGCTFASTERTTLRDTLHQSLHFIMAGIGLSHPRFTRVAVAVSPEGAGRLGLA
jgi:hypothetical protein